MTRARIVGALLFAVFAATGCPAHVEKKAPAPSPKTGASAPRPPLPGPSQAICDPSGCPIFCFKAACGATREACLARCERVCGDGYFDDRDGPVMACTLADRGKTPAEGCAALGRCCDLDYTSQFCDGSTPRTD